MMKSAAEEYIDLVGEDRQSRLALYACATALRLDDEIASKTIKLTAGSNGSTDGILRRIKNLGCVWRQWDGTWRLAEDVRPYLLDRFEMEVPEETRGEVRRLLASHADKLAQKISSDGQISVYRNRQAKFEGAYQRTLTPDLVDEGAKGFADIWRNAKGGAIRATEEAVDYLSTEMESRLKKLPSEILFMKGMAARGRGDKRGEEKYFKAVWENGRSGDIYAIAAHLFGLLVRDRKIAEKAFRNSIGWNEAPYHKTLVLHSLGNLLSKNRNRWHEAEEAYKKSIELAPDTKSRAQTWHSLGNLYAKSRNRWHEAEEAYQKGIELWDNPGHKGQVWHSLANFYAKSRNRWHEAEKAYKKGIELWDDSSHKGQVWHSLGNLYAKNRNRWHEAEEAYRRSIELRDNPSDKGQAWHSLGNLYAKSRNRWHEAEEAYKKSIELCDNPSDKGQVYASWADGLFRLKDPEMYDNAEKCAMKVYSLAPHNPWTCGVANRVLAGIYESRGDYEKAIKALEALMETDRKLGKTRFKEKLQARIAKLRNRL